MKIIQLNPTSENKHTIVDNEDYEYLKEHKWHLLPNGYAVRHEWNTETKKQKMILMHRVILNTPEDLHTDHKDGNRLNNCRSNLRVATRSQNLANRPKSKIIKSSKFKGVRFEDRIGKKARWRASITYNRKVMMLGSFNYETEAAKAYDKKAKELFGEFAYLNYE